MALSWLKCYRNSKITFLFFRLGICWTHISYCKCNIFIRGNFGIWFFCKLFPCCNDNEKYPLIKKVGTYVEKYDYMKCERWKTWKQKLLVPSMERSVNHTWDCYLGSAAHMDLIYERPMFPMETQPTTSIHFQVLRYIQLCAHKLKSTVMLKYLN